MYSTFIQLLFKEEVNNNISQKKYFCLDVGKIKEQREKDENKKNTFSEEHYIFIRNEIEYLSKNTEQNISQNINTNNKKNYCQSLPCSAPESISELIISFKETY